MSGIEEDASLLQLRQTSAYGRCEPKCAIARRSQALTRRERERLFFSAAFRRRPALPRYRNFECVSIFNVFPYWVLIFRL